MRCRREIWEFAVMEAEWFRRREKMLDLREELLAVREGRLEGAKEYTVNEVAAMMYQAVEDHKPF